jgi:hypothetical protein
VPARGVRAVGPGRHRMVIRDLPLADRPVVVVWCKRLWRSPEPARPARSWSEECDQIAPRAVLTERARAEIARRVGPAEHSVAQAARDFVVSSSSASAHQTAAGETMRVRASASEGTRMTFPPGLSGHLRSSRDPVCKS